MGILPEYIHMLAVIRPTGFLDLLALADKAGIPRGSIAPGAACVIILALTAWCVLAHGRGRELLSLSLLAFLSYVVFFHHIYDLIVLVFPLTFLFTPERHDRPAVSALLVATVVLTWFLEKPVYVLRHQYPGTTTEMVYVGYYWTTVATFYASAIAVGLALVRRTH